MGKGTGSVGCLHCGVAGLPHLPLVSVDARSTGRRSRKRRPAKTPPINTIAPARAYYRAILPLVAALRRDMQKHILPLVNRAVKESDAELTRDAIEDDISEAFEKLKVKYNSPNILLPFMDSIKSAGLKTSKLHKTQTESQFQSLGIDIFKESKSLSRLMRRFTSRNFDMIKSIPADVLAESEKIVTNGVATGLRNEVIAARLISESPPGEDATPGQIRKAKQRAAVIARDQVLTFSQQLSKARQQANGIESFIWRTVGDGRVRELHEPREGQEYTWKTGASGGDPFPGSGVQCRCWSEPVI